MRKVTDKLGSERAKDAHLKNQIRDRFYKLVDKAIKI